MSFASETAGDLVGELEQKSYWPAVALRYLRKGDYARAEQICRRHCDQHPDIISGQVILGQALFFSGQYEAAEERFYRVLRQDPDNLKALKSIGDLKNRAGNESSAKSFYQRIRQLCPSTSGLSTTGTREQFDQDDVFQDYTELETNRTGEHVRPPLPIVTETVGDLLLAQGHIQEALEIYRALVLKQGEPRIQTKIAKTKSLLKKKGIRSV